MEPTPRSISKALVTKAQKGDTKAFEELELAGRDKVIACLARFVFDYTQVEELYQLALIKAWTNINKFRNDACFETWLIRIALNGAKDWMRTQNKKKTNSIYEYMEDQSRAKGEGPRSREWQFLDRFGRTVSIENEGYRNEVLKEERVRIEEALSVLPEQHKKMLLRFILDEVEYKDLAKEFGIPIGTVMSRLHYAKKYAKRALSNNNQSVYLKAASRIKK